MQNYQPNDIVYIHNIGFAQLLNCGNHKTLKLKKKYNPQLPIIQIPYLRKQKQSLCFDPQSFRLDYEEPIIQIANEKKVQQIKNQNNGNQSDEINIITAKLYKTNILIYTLDKNLSKEIKVRVKVFFGKRQQLEIFILIHSTIMQLKNKILEATKEPITNFQNVRLISTNGSVIQYSNNKQFIYSTKINNNSKLILLAHINFTFDTHFKGDLLKLNNNNKTLLRNNNDNGNYQICLGSTQYYHGKHYFETKIQKFADQQDLIIGVAKKNISFTFENLEKQPIWGYMCMAGKKIGQNQDSEFIKDFGIICKQNDVIGTLINIRSNKATLSYYVNGKFIGKMFENIEPPICPAFCLNSGNIQITINTNVQIPFDLMTSVL